MKQASKLSISIVRLPFRRRYACCGVRAPHAGPSAAARGGLSPLPRSDVHAHILFSLVARRLSVAVRVFRHPDRFADVPAHLLPPDLASMPRRVDGKLVEVERAVRARGRDDFDDGDAGDGEAKQGQVSIASDVRGGRRARRERVVIKVVVVVVAETAREEYRR